MKIISIKWNPHYINDKFNYYETKVIKEYNNDNKNTYEYCKSIVEESLIIYRIFFWNGTSIRIFNPIEVKFYSTEINKCKCGLDKTTENSFFNCQRTDCDMNIK